MIEIQGIKMYDTEETARLFNVSKTAIQTLRRKGLLRYSQLGYKRYTSEEAIKDYLNGVVIPQPKPQPVGSKKVK